MAQRMKGKTIKAPPVKPASAPLEATRPAPAPSPAGPAASPTGLVDLELVRGLAEIASREGLSELKVKTAGAVIIVRRGTAPSASPAQALHPVAHAPAHVLHGPAAHTVAAHPVPPAPSSSAHAPPAPVVPADDTKFVFVSSPFVGTFYRSPSPEAPTFVEVGQRVKRGQVLCIVEAMKLMNEIEAETDGTVAEVLVENAQPVEYGQQLFKIAP